MAQTRLQKALLLLPFVVCLVMAYFIIDAQAEENDLPSYTRLLTHKETYQISLDSRDIQENQKVINLEQYNLPAPEECNQPRVVCDETSEINVEVVKTWYIKHLPDLTDPELSSTDFARHYAALPAGKTITKQSPLEDQLIVERILYERGLLERPPTGNVNSYQVERAIIKLQQIKEIEEFDYYLGKAIIGPETVAELNGLKERMQEPNYLEDFPLPEIEPYEYKPIFKKRLNSINNTLTNTPLTPDVINETEKNQEKAADIMPDKENLNGSKLIFNGNAEIVNQTNQE